MFRTSISTVALFAFAAGGFAGPAQAARYTAPCAGTSLRSMASHTHSRISACIARPGEVVTETMYYQNASKVGGTALAAFPEARTRYGVGRHLELFLDWPSEVAKSGLRGAGVYYMTQIGVGAKFEFARKAGVDYTITLERRPPMSAFANMDVVPNADVHVDATWAPSRLSTATVEVGAFNYTQRGLRSWTHTSPTMALAVTRELDRKTAATFELTEQSVAAFGGSSRTTVTLGLQRLLSKHAQVNLELGSALNATAGSKPHELGFGFIVH